MNGFIYGECFRLGEGGPAFFAAPDRLLGELAGWQRLEGVRAGAVRVREMPCSFQKGIFPVWNDPIHSFACAFLHPVTGEILMVERAAW